MRSLRACLLVLCLAPLAACSEKGPDVEKVKQDITAELNAFAGPDGQKYLTYDAVDAAAANDKVKVTIKGTKFLVPGAEPLTIGDIELQALPKGEDQYEISDLRIPPQFTFKGPAGDIVVDIGTQNWAGLWSTKYHTYLSADAKYGGIKVSGPAMEGATVDLGEITLKSASEDKGNGTFDQTTTGTLKSLAFSGPEGSGTFNGGEFRSELKGAKLAELQALGRDWQSLALAAGEGKPTDAALLTRLKGYAGVLAALSTHADLTGVSFKDPSGAEMFSLEHLVIDGGGSALDQPKAGLSFGLELLGLKVPAADLDPAVAAHRQFIPTIVRLGYALDDLPAKELWAAWLDLIGGGVFQPGNEAAAEMAAQAFGMQFVQLANEAGSAFRLTNLELEAPAARFKMDGSVKGDAASPMGVTGAANIEVTGLDAMADAVRQSMPPEEAAGVGGAFDLVRGFSNRETTADNKVVDRYAVVLAPTGEMTINNKPFDLFGTMMGVPTDPGAPPQ
jgi:hypothetical protein